MWTVSKVKAELPQVTVNIGKKKLIGRLSGRLNEFATVTCSYIDNGKPSEYLRGQPWVDFHFSWETIANALNNGRALKV